MKKVILACDGNEFPRGAFEFIKQLRQQGPLLLTGAFLHSLNFQDMYPVAFAVKAGPLVEILEEERKVFRQTVQHFTEACDKEGIEYRVHTESNYWNINDLTIESRFADLMIMSEELFCNIINANEPNSFMQQAIKHAECPVMLIPENYRGINNIILAYDGSRDSMFAIKQFAQLLPEFCSREARIVYIRDEATDRIPRLEYLEEYAGRHFKNLAIEKLHFNGKKFFNTWLATQEEVLVITGSYGKSGFFSSFSKSFSEGLIHEHRVSLFIAHP